MAEKSRSSAPDLSRARADATDAKERLDALLGKGREVNASQGKDEILRAIEYTRARLTVLKSTQYAELGASTQFLLDILAEHMRSGALAFVPEKR